MGNIKTTILKHTPDQKIVPSIPRKWALFLPTGNTLSVFVEGGEIRSAEMGDDARSLISEYDNFACFSPELKAVMALADARYFQGKQRREKLLEVRLDDGPKIATLPNPTALAEPYAYAYAFSTYAEWLTGQGIEFDKRAGWGTMGRRIWTQQSTPVKFRGPPQARLAFYGGRKQAPYPATYQDASHYDITAAYLHALGTNPIPQSLKACKPNEWRTPGLDGICFATVTVPDGEWTPLPERADKRIVRMLRFRGGNLAGAWSFSELRLAADYGCKVEAIESFAGMREQNYFANWYTTMIEGRELKYGAAIFAKQHANLLWSSFATSPTRITYKRYRDSFGHLPTIIKEIKPGKDFSGRTSFLSAIVAGRVRERLYREVLVPEGIANLSVVHCDTDGIITGNHNTLPEALTSGTGKPGEWRKTKGLPIVEIRAANTYRYVCNDCGWGHARWHYSCAGMSNPDSARRLFEDAPKGRHSMELNSEEISEELLAYKPKIRRRNYAGIN